MYMSSLGSSLFLLFDVFFQWRTFFFVITCLWWLVIFTIHQTAFLAVDRCVSALTTSLFFFYNSVPAPAVLFSGSFLSFLSNLFPLKISLPQWKPWLDKGNTTNALIVSSGIWCCRVRKWSRLSPWFAKLWPWARAKKSAMVCWNLRTLRLMSRWAEYSQKQRWPPVIP